MAKSNINSKKGFTIIEVVLVLAIAGLIFLMVFIALPALQRSQRNTQRRDDMARLSTAINQYQTNNSGKLPNNDSQDTVTKAGNSEGILDDKDFIKKYLGGADEFVDPSGEFYTITFKRFKEGASNEGEPVNTLEAGTEDSFRIMVYTRARCNGETAEHSANRRDFAIVYKLEGSGVYCSDSQ